MKSAITCLAIAAGGIYFFLSGLPQTHGDAAMVLTAALAFISVQAFVLMKI